MIGLYLYGFARPSPALLLHARGVGFCPQVTPDHESDELSLHEHSALQLIPFRNVTAICREVDLADYLGEQGERNLQNPSWVIPRACDHEGILASFLVHGPVLPVRFGAVFSSRLALKATVAERRPSIERFLEFIIDKQEWSFRASLHGDYAMDWLIQNDQALSERYRGLSKSPGVRYLQEKQLKALAGKHLQGLVRNQAEEMLTCLRDLALEVREIKRKHAVPSGAAEEVVLNCACLLSTDGVDAFHQEVEQLQSAGNLQGLSIETTGPWPPYHFCPQWTEPS
jgi:hypothetical protein